MHRHTRAHTHTGCAFLRSSCLRAILHEAVVVGITRSNAHQIQQIVATIRTQNTLPQAHAQGTHGNTATHQVQDQAISVRRYVMVCMYVCVYVCVCIYVCMMY